MPAVVDYATLSQAILDYTHRATLSTYVGYFIQAAQEEINSDIFAQNFGRGIRFMEAVYPATAIDGNGNAPVPSDWLAPKDFTISADSDVFDLEFKDPQWIYARYPDRAPCGVPSYIARDLSPGYPTVAPSVAILATAGQTNFNISALSGDTVLFAMLDGAMLVPTTDYSIAGTTLTLVHGASLGQTLYAQSAAPSEATAAGSTYLTALATTGQTAFDVTALNGATILFATLDGAMLVPAVDYSVAGDTLTLTLGADLGQLLYVQAASSAGSSGTSVFIFGPAPDGTYNIQGAYYSQAPLLSSSQTTNWMVLNAPSMLLANCMRQAGKFLKDTEMVQGWTALYQDALTKLIERDSASRYGEAPLTISEA